MKVKNYYAHLLANVFVAAHALIDVFAHVIHGLIPAVKIKHHQPNHQIMLEVDGAKLAQISSEVTSRRIL